MIIVIHDFGVTDHHDEFHNNRFMVNGSMTTNPQPQLTDTCSAGNWIRIWLDLHISGYSYATAELVVSTQ